jgi:hypothetical protein
MKKLLLVFDGDHYPSAPLDLMLHFKPDFVTAAFLSPLDYSALWANPLIPGSTVSYVVMTDEVDRRTQKMVKNMQSFAELCSTNDQLFRVHDDSQGNIFEQISKESRFADLMVICSDSFYEQFGEQPNDYLKEVLHDSECPILLIPEKFILPLSNLLFYDGSSSSVFAMKQFAYLLPDLAMNPTTLISASSEKEMPDSELLLEWALRYFPGLDLTFLRKKPDARGYALNHGYPSPIVVLGAFGRNDLSVLFRKSFSNEFIRNNKSAVFISHQ